MSKIIEGPAEKQLFEPGGAAKLPTKNYPASSKLPTGKKTEIEGPCKESYHK